MDRIDTDSKYPVFKIGGDEATYLVSRNEDDAKAGLSFTFPSREAAIGFAGRWNGKYLSHMKRTKK